MTRRRRRAVLALGALAAAAAHCAALEPSGRRLITFDEHNALAETVTEVANEAVNTVNSLVSTLLDPSDVSVTIGSTDSGADEDTATVTITETPVRRTPTPTERPVTETSVRRTPTPTEPPVTETPAIEETPIPTRQSGLSHAVSMTKRPVLSTLVTRTPRATRHADYSSSDTTGNESTETDATPTAVPPTQPPTRAPTAVEAPVTIELSTPAPGAPAVVDVPVTVVTTAPVQQTELTPVPIDSRHSSTVDDLTDAPATTGSTIDDTAVVLPDESTVLPITDVPAEETGSSDTGSPAAGVPATRVDASGSNSINETVKVDSASGSEENSDGISPGQVHASSSADISVGGSDMSDVQGSNSSKQKKGKNNRKSHSGSGDYSAESSTSSSKGASEASTSDSGCSDDGSRLGHFLNPGGASDANTSSAAYYSLGTGSIVAIVGVIAAIGGVLVMFVAIGRKTYSDDDDESPLPYGYNIDIRSVPRLSPTFMQDDSFMESGYN
ncbi:hypothetical protein PHMEG_00030305, partial [Phytophthora megakarya]